MRLVVISGVDGAGKTTLAEGVAESLRRDGRPAVRLYGRIVPVLSLKVFALVRALLGRTDGTSPAAATTSGPSAIPASAAPRRRLHRSPLLATAFATSICLEYLVQIWIRLLPHLGRDRIVVADRYVYDTVIQDVAVHLGLSRARTRRLVGLVARFVPEPDLALLLDVDATVAFARKDDTPDMTFLLERIPFFEDLAERKGFVVLDAGVPPGDLLEDALAALRLARVV